MKQPKTNEGRNALHQNITIIKKVNIMIYKDHKNRKSIRNTLEYMFRENPEHGHKMDKVIYLHGSSTACSPLTFDENGKVIDVDVTELVEEFEFQTSLYKGSARDSKFYNHASLSLQANEKLTTRQWEDAAKMLQDELGLEFDKSLYCGAIHLDKEEQLHIHLASNRVDINGKLISQHNNWEKAQKATKKICEKFALEVIPNSFDELLNESNDSIDLLNKRIKREGDKSFKCQFKDVDVRAKIRQTIAAVFNHDKPKTISDYANSLQKRGVIIKGIEGKIGECVGVKYKMPSLKGKYYSGSKVSATHASWGSILNPQRKGLDYNPMRDNPSLGLSGVRVRVKVNKAHVSRIKRLKLNVVVRSYRGQYFTDLAFKNSNADLLMEAIMEVIMKILAMLFGGSYVDYYTPLELSGSKIIHETDSEKVYDGSDIQQCMQNVDSDTACWLDDGSDPHDLGLVWDKAA